MAWYVYIIESLADGTFYKGESESPLKRLNSHNMGFNKSTESKRPWKLVYVCLHVDRKAVKKEERRLKRCNKTYLRWLLEQPGNLVNDPDALSRLA